MSARRPGLSAEELKGELTLFESALAGVPSAVSEVVETLDEDDVDGDEENVSGHGDNMDKLVEQEAAARPACDCGVAKGLRSDHEAECAFAYLHRPPDDCEPIPGVTCRNCGGAIFRPKGGKKIGGKVPYGCMRCGNVDPKDVEEQSYVARLLSAKPKQVRRAAFGLVATLVDAIEKHPWWASAEVRLDTVTKLEEADGWAKWFERRGALEGLAVRLPGLKGPRLASVIEDCLDLAVALIDEEDVVLPTSVVVARGANWAKKELARRIRAELAPKEDAVEEKWAALDGTLAYRLSLGRIWDRALPPMVLFGLNPSTADAEKDDQTIRRGRTFAKREGKGSLLMLNLFAFRSTDPKLLETVEDPVGPKNDETIRTVLMSGGGPKLVVCAWGSLANEKQRARAKEVVEMIRDAGCEPMCFGRTKDRSPRHPSRLANDVVLEDYRGEELGVRWFGCATCQDVGCSYCL